MEAYYVGYDVDKKNLNSETQSKSPDGKSNGV